MNDRNNEHTETWGALELEDKIVSSGVRDIFTPHRPIQTIELFFGRKNAVLKMVEHLNTPGQHALLYGDRGVGKSSLANITTSVIIEKIMGTRLFTKRCSSQDDFISIFREPLESVGVEIDHSSTSVTKTEGGNAGLDIKIVKAGLESERSKTRIYKNATFSPSNVAESLIECKGLLYIDEADQIQSSDDKKCLAETIKLLSDNGSPFKILIVGIAETGAELCASHLSVERCLRETKLDRMEHSEIQDLVERGSKKCGYNFDAEVVNAIVDLSSGYAHFAHLLALKCVEVAIADEQVEIDRYILHRAIVGAVEDAEGTLKRNYDETVRTAKHADLLASVLYAAAKIGPEYEFTARQWRDEYADIYGNEMTSQRLSGYVQRLVANDESKIIRRMGKAGVYKFNDPRMPSYIKLVNQREK